MSTMVDNGAQMAAGSRVEIGGWVAGIGAVILVIAGFFAIDAAGATPPDGPVGVLVAEILEAPGRILVGAAVGSVGSALFVWFGATLRNRMGRAGGAGTITGSIAFGFAVIACGAGFAHAGFRLALTSVDDPLVLGEAVRALAIVSSQAMTVLVLALIGLAVTMCAGGWAIRLLPRTMSAVGLVMALAAIVFVPTDRGGFGLLLMLWLVVACALMLRRRSASAGSDARP